MAVHWYGIATLKQPSSYVTFHQNGEPTLASCIFQVTFLSATSYPPNHLGPMLTRGVMVAWDIREVSFIWVVFARTHISIDEANF